MTAALAGTDKLLVCALLVVTLLLGKRSRRGHQIAY